MEFCYNSGMSFYAEKGRIRSSATPNGADWVGREGSDTYAHNLEIREPIAQSNQDIEVYDPGLMGSATYDHLSGKITPEQYRIYLDDQRAKHGLPPLNGDVLITQRLAESNPTLESTPDNAFLTGDITREQFHEKLNDERSELLKPQS